MSKWRSSCWCGNASLWRDTHTFSLLLADEMRLPFFFLSLSFRCKRCWLNLSSISWLEEFFFFFKLTCPLCLFNSYPSCPSNTQHTHTGYSCGFLLLPRLILSDRNITPRHDELSNFFFFLNIHKALNDNNIVCGLNRVTSSCSFNPVWFYGSTCFVEIRSLTTSLTFCSHGRFINCTVYISLYISNKPNST